MAEYRRKMSRRASEQPKKQEDTTENAGPKAKSNPFRDDETLKRAETVGSQ